MPIEARNSDLGWSPDIVATNAHLVEWMLPQVLSEGRIDVAALRRAVGDDEVADGGERYALTWAGKLQAYKVLQAQSSATIRPQPELSVNFETASHVFVEGENLEVLKVLQKAYFARVKMIYLDPPYNTGNDSFIYPDRFQESKQDYLKRINDIHDDGTLMREGFFHRNTRESGHLHSNWLSMILPRLYLARNLLADDGAIFVSCDDNEVYNLRCLLNEVFGEDNFVAQLVWKARQFVDARAVTNVSTDHEYILVYGRTPEFAFRGVERDETKFSNPDNDPRGPWMSRSILGLATKDQRPNLHYDIIEPGSERPFPPHPMRGWRYSREKMRSLIADGRILFPSKDDGRPREKKFRSDLLSEHIAFPSIIEGIYTADGTKEIRDLFGAQIFDFPKPSKLIALLATQVLGKEDILLDFFAGSGSSFDAVVSLNASDGGNRKCVLVQLPEPTQEGSEAQRAGFGTIAEICRDRLRRSIARRQGGEQQLEFNAALGFKSFVLAPSNFREWRGDAITGPDDLAEQIEMFARSEKDGASTQWMLFELLLKCGQPVTSNVEHLAIGGTTAYRISDAGIVLLLENIDDSIIDAIVQLAPRTVVALDSIFAGSDELKSNLDLHCRDHDIRLVCV